VGGEEMTKVPPKNTRRRRAKVNAIPKEINDGNALFYGLTAIANGDAVALAKYLREVKEVHRSIAVALAQLLDPTPFELSDCLPAGSDAVVLMGHQVSTPSEPMFVAIGWRLKFESVGRGKVNPVARAMEQRQIAAFIISREWEGATATQAVQEAMGKFGIKREKAMAARRPFKHVDRFVKALRRAELARKKKDG
jgi:hypothetical protein